MGETEDTRNSLLEQLDALEQLPTLPAIAQQVISKALDPKVTYKALQKIIVNDPPLAARVLKTANSIYYSRRIRAKTIEEAIFTIGLNDLSSICLSTGVIESFNHFEQRLLDRRLLWKHSISTAALLDGIAKKNNVNGNISYFLAGLLHDIGWMVLDHLVPEELGKALQIAEKQKWSNKLEKDIFGLHHADIGAIILERWSIPPEIIPIILSHHDPDKADEFALPAKFLQMASAMSPFQLPLISIDSEIEFNKSYGKGADVKNPTLDKMKEFYQKEIKYSEHITELSLGWI